MDVTETITINEDHSIEFGNSSYEAGEPTIRRRYDPNGKFSPHGSSEISINGFLNITDMYVMCLERDLIDPAAMSRVLNAIIESARRNNNGISII